MLLLALIHAVVLSVAPHFRVWLLRRTALTLLLTWAHPPLLVLSSKENFFSSLCGCRDSGYKSKTTNSDPPVGHRKLFAIHCSTISVFLWRRFNSQSCCVSRPTHCPTLEELRYSRIATAAHFHWDYELYYACDIMARKYVINDLYVLRVKNMLMGFVSD